jgi:7-cyano-7-deazaguanine synthase
MKQCIVLLSGGIDSTTSLYWARGRYEKIHALTIDYGQRHKVEIEQAKEIALNLKISHQILFLDLTQIGGSTLTDRRFPLPRIERRDQIGKEIPSTYVPFRNGILLGLAAALGEKIGIEHIICGFNIIDSPHYPDTRPSFVKAMEKAIKKGTRMGHSRPPVKIIAPFIRKKKSDIIRAGLSMGVDYSQTISCYAGLTTPCGSCSACVLRQEAWEEVGQEDPLIAKTRMGGFS